MNLAWYQSRQNCGKKESFLVHFDKQVNSLASLATEGRYSHFSNGKGVFEFYIQWKKQCNGQCSFINLIKCQKSILSRQVSQRCRLKILVICWPTCVVLMFAILSVKILVTMPVLNLSLSELQRSPNNRESGLARPYCTTPGRIKKKSFNKSRTNRFFVHSTIRCWVFQLSTIGYNTFSKLKLNLLYSNLLILINGFPSSSTLYKFLKNVYSFSNRSLSKIRISLILGCF